MHKETGIYYIIYMVKLGYKYVKCMYLVTGHRLNYLGPPTNKYTQKKTYCNNTDMLQQYMDLTIHDQKQH